MQTSLVQKDDVFLFWRSPGVHSKSIILKTHTQTSAHALSKFPVNLGLVKPTLLQRREDTWREKEDTEKKKIKIQGSPIISAALGTIRKVKMASWVENCPTTCFWGIFFLSFCQQKHCPDGEDRAHLIKCRHLGLPFHWMDIYWALGMTDLTQRQHWKQFKSMVS